MTADRYDASVAWERGYIGDWGDPPPGTGGWGIRTGPTVPTTMTGNTVITNANPPEPDDDVKANLRHLCDEAVNVLREQLHSKTGATSLHEQTRVNLALRILKECGCPPG